MLICSGKFSLPPKGPKASASVVFFDKKGIPYPVSTLAVLWHFPQHVGMSGTLASVRSK